MTREIMKEIKGLFAKGCSGREIVAMGYAESTVREVGDMMVLRDFPGITATIRQELLRADNAEVLRRIRRELKERGFKYGSIATEVSKLQKKGELVFDQPKSKARYNHAVAQLWEEYREKKAQLLKEDNDKVAQLLREYEEKVARGRKNRVDEVERLQEEVEARDRLLKKLMERLKQDEQHETKQ